MTFHTNISKVDIAPEAELVLYQVAREALTNAATHSRAVNVWLDLHQDPECVWVRVRDDGIGFDASVESERHYGLAIMRERALSLEGQLFVDSMPGRGCEVSLIIQQGAHKQHPST